MVAMATSVAAATQCTARSCLALLFLDPQAEDKDFSVRGHTNFRESEMQVCVLFTGVLPQSAARGRPVPALHQ